MVIQVAKIVTIAPWTVGSLSFLVNFIYYHPYPQTAPDWKRTGSDTVRGT